VVRDLARQCGKQVRIEMEGKGTELDRTLIEAISDPLTHLVRNALDHGIEPPSARIAAGKPPEGRLLLRAFHESGQVIVEVAEDGAGIDCERVRARALESGLITAEQARRMGDDETIRLIFSAGLSTAKNLSHVSGRGVGMDVVKTNVEKIGGTVDVHSARGEGTTVRIKIPLTLAIIPALIVSCESERYAIPQVNLVELVRLDPDDSSRRMEMVHQTPVYRLRGTLLPLIVLAEALGLRPPGAERATGDILVLQIGEQRFGLLVDDVIDTEEIVVKAPGSHLAGLPVCAGATILGDGRVALILDILAIARSSQVLSAARQDGFGEASHEAEHAAEHRQLLVCRTGASRCAAVPLGLVARLEEFPASKVENAGGAPVVQYRGAMLPLISMAGMAPEWEAASGGTLRAVVCDDGTRKLAITVEDFIDIVDGETTAAQRAERDGLLGSGIVAGRVTDFLDVESAMRILDSAPSDHSPVSAGRKILLIDPSRFSRSLVRSYLELEHYEVFEATTADAVARVGQTAPDLILISADSISEPAFLQQIRSAGGGQTPIVGLGLGNDSDRSSQHAGEFDVYHLKTDRQGILDTIAKLIQRPTAEREAAADPSPSGAPTASTAAKFLTFYLNSMLFGVEASRVQEVLGPQPITHVPLVSAVVCGLINLRGQIVTTINLRESLGLPSGEQSRGAGMMNVVVRAANEIVGLQVDEVGEVIEAAGECFEQPPNNLDPRVSELIIGVCKLEDRLLLVLDIDRAIGSGIATLPNPEFRSHAEAPEAMQR
ncbi:MAG TPA: chemotaxis protein CheW, partial [Candidatus Binataceae bacterium]|nr:chemotaxis protein CheW [Candidatus Binataceae bacterium]